MVWCAGDSGADPAAAAAAGTTGTGAQAASIPDDAFFHVNQGYHWRARYAERYAPYCEPGYYPAFLGYNGRKWSDLRDMYGDEQYSEDDHRYYGWTCMAQGYSRGCPSYRTCGQCTNDPGCGWCPSQRRCFAGGPSGPVRQQCGRAWTYWGPEDYEEYRAERCT